MVLRWTDHRDKIITIRSIVILEPQKINFNDACKFLKVILTLGEGTKMIYFKETGKSMFIALTA